MLKGSGNVFTDLGFSEPEAASLQIRAALMVQICKMIDQKHLTQAAAARRLGVSQPRVSDLVRGRIERFSIDALVKMIARTGVQVRLVVSRRTRAA